MNAKLISVISLAPVVTYPRKMNVVTVKKKVFMDTLLGIRNLDMEYG